MFYTVYFISINDKEYMYQRKLTTVNLIVMRFTGLEFGYLFNCTLGVRQGVLWLYAFEDGDSEINIQEHATACLNLSVN